MKLDRAGLSRRDLFDAALAVLLVALSYSLLAGPVGPDSTIAWILASAHSLPVAARRRAPRAAFAFSTAAGLAYLFQGYNMIGLGITVLVVMYSLAAEVPRRDSLVGSLLLILGFLVAVATRFEVEVDTVVGNVIALAAAWLLGDSANRRREQGVLESAMRAEQAVADERLRIARELHDVVAHSMSVVTVQAGMARMVLEDDPEKARRSLIAIEAAGRQAMNEMRRLLHVLRDDRGPAEAAALSPSPGLRDLSELVEAADPGGTVVELAVDGERRELAAGVELAAYRVVQEAITNVRKHAPGSTARVRIEYTPDELLISIDSDLVAQHSPGQGGHGLTGMRERVELYRGRLETGPADDGTFRVMAHIPYAAVPA